MTGVPEPDRAKFVQSSPMREVLPDGRVVPVGPVPVGDDMDSPPAESD